MKKLIFVRHGKAQEPSADVSDLERSLTTKGKVISRQMARRLMGRENSLGTIITSPAFRAYETAAIFAEEFKTDPEKIMLNSNIYHRMNLAYLPELFATISEETSTLTFFGHNPSFTELANALCMEGCDMIPKCGIVCVSFNAGIWSDVRRDSGKLDFFLKP